METPTYSLPGSVPEKKKGCGCFGIGCGIVVVLLAIAIGIGCFMGYGVYNYVKSFTSDKADAIPVVQSTDAEWEALRQRVDTFNASAKAGQPSSLQLTDREINILIDRHPDFEPLKNHAYIQILDGTLNAKISYPLTGVPGFSGRFLNGDAKLQITVDNGALKINAQELKVGDQTAPPEILRQIEQELSGKMMSDPDTQTELEKVKTFKFEGNSLLIETKAGPAALPEGEAAPLPNAEPEPAPTVE